jgi:N-acyl homoserine lactone hydrolase
MSNDDLRLHVLDTGLIECADYAIFSPRAEPRTRQDMSVRSYLVVHPAGTLLWDTGIADAIAGRPEGERITDDIVFKVPVTLGSQLEALGARVDVLGLSHLHIDHVGNVGRFRGVPVLLHEAEYAAGFGPDPESFTLMPETYAALDRDAVRTVAGEHDVFGDGTVVITPLPGHTPGHQGLLVRLPRTGPVLLAGDIAYSADDFAAGAVRRANVDLERSAASIEAAKRIARELGARVWLHHDRAAQREIAVAPAAYG